jgi:hypothetical protein
MASCTYARDGAVAFVEARAIMALRCVGAEEANIGLINCEV